MRNFFLSEHFQLSEFVHARHMELVTDEVVANLQRLCVTLLEPVRSGMDVPITVSSGWRPLSHNAAVGGVSTSDHVKGNAADLQIWTNGRLDIPATQRLFRWIKDNCFGRFGQLILEDHWKASTHKVWVHVSNITAKHPGGSAGDILFSPEKGVYKRYVDGMENEETV